MIFGLTETLEDKLRLFRSMAFDNQAMLNFLDQHPLEDIPHIDEKCVIFSLKGEGDKTLKYGVHPMKYTCIDSYLQGVTLRGLKNQMFVQGIEGVQRLSSFGFYEEIPGLLGKFEYLPGYNLKLAPKAFSQDSEKVFALFKEIDATLAAMHAKKIIHKDVKPGNIVYSKERLHLIDFSTSTNFTEELMDRTLGCIFGTPGYIFMGSDRSKDYFALGVSFAKVLFPELSLRKLDVRNIAGLRIYEFESDMRRDLLKEFGYSFTEYFNDLMHRKPEIDYGSVAERIASVPHEEGVNVNYSFNVGNTTFVQEPVSTSVYSI